MNTSKERIAKPLYFYNRWKSAEGSKKDYYASRLKTMGIDVNSGDEVITANDKTVMVGKDIVGVVVHIVHIDWRTAKIVL